MKLYATTTSERASKGQGGNKHIEVMIMRENRSLIFCIRLQVISETQAQSQIIAGGEVIYNRIITLPKGNKQKGELEIQHYTCKGCGRVATDWKGNSTETCPKCEILE